MTSPAVFMLCLMALANAAFDTDTLSFHPRQIPGSQDEMAVIH